MNEKWEIKRLGDVCDLIARGVAPSYIDDGGICVLNQKCVRDHQVSYELARRHDAAAKRVNPERLLRAGDVLINSTGTGTLGRVAQVREEPPEPTTVDTHVTIVRPQTGRFYPDFFGYMLVQIEDEIAASGEGASGQTELARSVIENRFRVSFPTSLAEQKRIVAILDEAFAGIAAATANAEKNLANARELFTSCLNSTFRNVPRGWTTTTLGAVCNFHGGSQPPKSVFERDSRDDLIRLIQIRDYKSDNHIVYIPKDQARRFCDASDVMIGRYGPPLFQILRGIEGAYNVALMKAVPDKKRITKDFLFYFLKNGDILKYIIDASSRAAGQIGLNKETLEPYPISFPSIDAQGHLVSRLANLESDTRRLVAIYEQKLLRLAELKQAILQKAFSGELTALPEAALQEEAA